MNWLDIVLIVILIITTILGFIKGLIRQVIGITAVILGLVLASQYYWGISEIFKSFIRNEFLCNFVSFLFVFICVLIIGSLLGYLLTKAMRGPLKFGNHLLGGVFGALKAVLICGVIVFALLVFEVARPALGTSQLAPVCYHITRAAAKLIPRELRAKFESSYRNVRKAGGEHGKKI